MALVFTTPDGPAGARPEFVTPTGGRQVSVVADMTSAASPVWGLQTAWAIDPLTGNDANVGTPAAPLRTMGEFNARMLVQFVSVAQTLQLVGDVLDQPLWLIGTRYASGASLTVRGTRTDVASGTVNVVAGLGAGGIRPWQLTTAGMDWTLVPVGAQVRFSTGQTSMILEVIDANNVIVGAIGTISGNTSAAPTVGSTVTAATLSRALPPMVLAQGLGTTFTFQLVLTDLSFDAAHDYVLRGGVPVQIFGCELKVPAVQGMFSTDNPANVKCCRLTYTGAGSWNWAPKQDLNTSGLVLVGTGPQFVFHPTGRSFQGDLAANGVRFNVNSNPFVGCGAMYFRRASGSPVLVNDGGALIVNGPINGAPLGVGQNAGFGLDTPTGRIWYVGAGNKPTVTGTSGDARVGTTTRTYAQIPFVNWDATVPTAFTGNGAMIIQI